MADNLSNFGNVSEQRIDPAAPARKPDIDAKRQSGRAPARPPYEQYLRKRKD